MKVRRDVDSKRVPRHYSVGEKVLLRVNPRKSSIKFGKSSKLALRFVGPFEVLEEINPVAYRIALLPTLARMHNVFHVSYLKKYILGDNHVIDWNALQVQDPRVVIVEPLKVLETCKLHLHKKEVLQCKVQWDQYAEDSATWEDYAEMKQKSPHIFISF
ncbi:uncharacterized protein LOC131044838 [Cryptomeria japonica]|uniref:uncharacterized protein LOC131044838 n=1 Tax=Cryptomeria japonica TaxID=3369 RepID=UPI0027DA017F|nr:uncharacterized protein LOC131044838 [Cryptomeria japonica]